MNTKIPIYLFILISALAVFFVVKKSHVTPPAAQDTPTSFTKETDSLSIDVTYPVIPGNDVSVKVANTLLKEEIDQEIASFEKDVEENPIVDLPPDVKSYVSGGATVEEHNERYVAIVMGMEWYSRGAAHPSHTMHTYVYDYELGKLVSMNDQFLLESKYLDLLSKLSKEDLVMQSKEGDLGFTYEETELHEGLTPTEDHFAHMIPLKDGLAIYFREYQVAPYAAGPQQVVIPYTKLQQVIDPQGIMGMYIQ